MKQTRSLEGNGFSSSQGILCVWWELTFHYCVHKRRPLVPIPRQISPLHAPFYIFKVHFTTVFHLFLCLPRCLFLLDFPTRTTTHLSSLPYVLHAGPSIWGCSWDNPRTVNRKNVGRKRSLPCRGIVTELPWMDRGRRADDPVGVWAMRLPDRPKTVRCSDTSARSLTCLGYLPTE
jgi:hypothetical protein